MPQTMNLFGFEYDVAAAARLIAARGTPPEVYQVADADAYLGFVVINASHARGVDLARPIIVIERAFGTARIRYRLPIDGWHRVYRARRAGVATLPAHVLRGPDELRVRI